MLRPEWPALGSVQYTIQKFYRINGGSTQRKGVTPDILMPTGKEETETGEKFEGQRTAVGQRQRCYLRGRRAI
ncbi:Tail-specific protease precursor [Kluyvera cryocrescens]|uniref:Tail-specific protease n=1 Tax=Kluyvera cryocrescens TaxID=580 RepID=A0A485A7H0_KLUCR|nr:Tail-specific protease precursor [Kluyvera cryocrescens]